MQIHIRVTWALVACILAGCGGGIEQAHHPSAVSAAAILDGAVQGAPYPPSMLVRWAEATYPHYFAPPVLPLQFPLTSGPYTYFFYSATRGYLGFSGQDVSVLGDFTGNTVRRMGTLSDYQCDVLPEACWTGAQTVSPPRVPVAPLFSNSPGGLAAYVVRDEQEWQSAWTQIVASPSTPAPIDFSRNAVIGGTAGWGWNGCSSLRTTVLRNGADYRILWRIEDTSAFSVCTQALTPHVALFLVDQPVGVVRFVQVPPCANPLPTIGAHDPVGPRFTFLFQDGVDAGSETSRLAATYGFQLVTVFSSTPAGFTADFPTTDPIAQLRCERSIKSIAHGELPRPG